MPTRSMLQVRVDQYVAPGATTIYAIDDWAARFLDPRQNTVVREMWSEEYGAVLASAGGGSVAAIEAPSSPFVRLDLFPVNGEDIIKLHGPSCVDSPAFDVRGGAMLRVFAQGYVITGGALAAGRVIAAHAYLDQGV